MAERAGALVGQRLCCREQVECGGLTYMYGGLRVSGLADSRG
jgi:hypothetical protein